MLCVSAALVAALALAPPAHSAAACTVAEPPNSLWSLAQCCARDLASDPDCRGHSEQGGYIILKDNSPAKPASYMIIPTAKVTGIEDSAVFAPPVADFWAAGWRQAQILLKQPAADTGLAINSAYGRTQNQLHIHISCVRRDVSRSLAENAAWIGSDPAKPLALPLGPRGDIYRVVKTRSLAAPSPFVLAAAMPGATNDMARQSIAAVGSRLPESWYVLETRQGGSNPGAAEELLEQACSST